MCCHRIPREYILAPAAKIKPARMSYGDPVRVPSARLRACPRTFARRLHCSPRTFRNSAFSCEDIGPVCRRTLFVSEVTSCAAAFLIQLESWFMDRLGLSFMARLGTLIFIFECVFVTSRESTTRELLKKIITRHLVEYKKNAFKIHNMRNLILIFLLI